MSDDTEADYSFLDDEDDTSEAPESEPVDETLWIAVGVSPTGFSLNVPETVNPITLAGVGWYLQQLAEVAVGNQNNIILIPFVTNLQSTT